MPDGDEIRKALGRNYQGAYQKICAGKSEDDDLVHSVVGSTIEQIKKYGDEPIHLLADIARLCEEMHVDMPLFCGSVDYPALYRHINTLAQEACMDKRAKHLVVDACREPIEATRQGGNFSKFHIELLHGYFRRVHRADFEAYVESGRDHMYHKSRSFVNETLNREKMVGQTVYITWYGSPASYLLG